MVVNSTHLCQIGSTADVVSCEVVESYDGRVVVTGFVYQKSGKLGTFTFDFSSERDFGDFCSGSDGGLESAAAFGPSDLW